MIGFHKGGALPSTSLSTERAAPLRKFCSTQISDVLCNLIVIFSSSVTCYIVGRFVNFVSLNDVCMQVNF